MTQEEFDAGVSKLRARKTQIEQLFKDGKIDKTEASKRKAKLLKDTQDLSARAREFNLQERTNKALGVKKDRVKRSGDAPKSLREYGKERTALNKELKTASGARKVEITKRLNVIDLMEKRLKTSATTAVKAAASDAGAPEPVAPKSGTGVKGRPAKYARYAPIVDPKTGRVNIGQARYLRKKGVIAASELKQYEDLALKRNARSLPEAERGPSIKGEAKLQTPKPGVTVSGPEDKPKARVEKRAKPKTSTTVGAPKEPKYRPKDYYKPTDTTPRAQLAAERRKYDDGLTSKSEWESAKKRFTSQQRAAARASGTKVVRGSNPAQLTKAQEAAANARDRAADQRDLANARDRAADIKSSKRIDVIRSRAKAAAGKTTEEKVAARYDRQGLTQKNSVLRNRAARAQGMSTQERAAARSERLGASAVAKEITPLMKIMAKPGVRAALRAAGVVGRAAGPVGEAFAIADAATKTASREGLTELAAARKAVMDGAAGKLKGQQGQNMFTTASLAQAKAKAKAAAAKVAMGQRADRNDSSKRAASSVRSADAVDSSRTTKPLTKTPKDLPTGRKVTSTGYTPVNGVYTVKAGDNLWSIAQGNKTTVSSLLKVNPVIAQRRKAGKVDIYSGSKVRIPKGKK